MDPHAIFMDGFRTVTDPSRLAEGRGRRALLMLGLSTFLNRSPEDGAWSSVCPAKTPRALHSRLPSQGKPFGSCRYPQPPHDLLLPHPAGALGKTREPLEHNSLAPGKVCLQLLASSSKPDLIPQD